MVSRYNSYKWMGHIFEDEKPEFGSEWKQLDLFIDPTAHVHKWYDDDGEKGMGFYCECGAFREVSLLDPYHGKTYQEVYEIMQRERHLKC
jgi:hypothetical protein